MIIIIFTENSLKFSLDLPKEEKEDYTGEKRRALKSSNSTAYIKSASHKRDEEHDIIMTSITADVSEALTLSVFLYL